MRTTNLISRFSVRRKIDPVILISPIIHLAILRKNVGKFGQGVCGDICSERCVAWFTGPLIQFGQEHAERPENSGCQVLAYAVSGNQSRGVLAFSSAKSLHPGYKQEIREN